jgi:hypothetical protein
MMRRGARFNANQARLKLSEERDYLPAPELAPNDRLTGTINAVNLKNGLRYIETDRRDRIHAGSSES